MRKKETAKRTPKAINRSKIQLPGLFPFNPLKELLDPEIFGSTIVECLENNQLDQVINVINTYLKFSNKATKQEYLSESYPRLKQKNPTLKTLTKIMHANAMKRKNT